MTPEEKKKLRDRANRARRDLLKEKEQHGYINDGSGKRYRAAVYYALAGENQKALDFYSWFEIEFSDDIGEPIFDLYRALVEFRAGNKQEASYRLQIAMLGNLYMLPFIFQQPIARLDIWHSSNRDYPDYILEVEEFLEEPTPEEREWIRMEYNSAPFSSLREEYVNVYHKLNHEHDFQKRGEIIDSWRRFSSQHFEKYG